MAPCLGPIPKAGSTCTAACARYRWTVDLCLSVAPCLGPIHKAGSTCTASCLRLTHYIWLQARCRLKNTFPRCYLKNRPPQVHSCLWPVPRKTVFSCFSYVELLIQIHLCLELVHLFFHYCFEFPCYLGSHVWSLRVDVVCAYSCGDVVHTEMQPCP